MATASSLVLRCAFLYYFTFVRLLMVSAVHSPDEIAARLAARGDDPFPQQTAGRGRRQLPTEISIQVTAPLFSSRMFDYGPENGDDEIPRSLDVGKSVDLSHPITMFGEDFNTVYILSNGAIGFDKAARSYRANVFPEGQKLIAPYWNRNDMRNGGRVFYRVVTTGRILERGQSEIRYQYDKTVKAVSCLLVTWVNMQPLGSNVLPDENANTFQVAIFSTDNGTYANYIYNNIGWTQGAEAGFNQGDSGKSYELPTSGTGNIMYLEEYGNTGIPGEWMFQIDMDEIVRCKPGIKGDTCDEQCGEKEWGYDCTGCCHCADGSKCNIETGSCPGECSACWFGPPTCQQRDDACTVRADGCAHNAISFSDYDRCGEPIQRCQCLAGYTGDGHKECIDIDECLSPDTCHANAVCTNTPGRFFCQCAEGFSGDGTNECQASFLYAYDNHQTLPKSKDAKVAWQLRYPLKIFGELRDRILISSNGFISVDRLPKYRPGERLEDQETMGFAPFFTGIDISKGGQISVDESTESDVLTRATRTVAENFYDPGYVAQSVVTITFVNVTKSKNNPVNTFQVNVIGGASSGGENITFVQFLYKDIAWTDGAEAVIMPLDVSNSVALPGSGTDGLSQLTQLSNIRSPGSWLFRVDPDVVFPCPTPTLQPPYCETELDQAPQPPGERRPPTVVEQSTRTSFQTARPTSRSSEPPRLPTVSIESVRIAPSSTVRQPVTSKPRPSFPSSPASGSQRPIISTSPENYDDEEIPEDAVRITFPPFITVIPQLFTPQATNRPGLIVPSIQTGFGQSGGRTSSRQPSSQFGRGPVTPPPGLKPAAPRKPPGSDVVVPPVRHGSQERPFLHSVDAPKSAAEPEPEPIKPNGPLVPELRSSSRTQPPTFTRIEAVPTGAPEPEPNDVGVTESSRPLFVFTTPKRVTHPVVPTRKKPVIVTATSPNFNGQSNTVVHSRPFDAGSRQGTIDDSPSKLAIIIPTAIVGVWLLLLLIIGLVVCCRKRRSRRHIRNMYGPAYHVRSAPGGGAYPAGGGGGAGGGRSKGAKGYPIVHGSYEDHLEKAARLSSEMSSYNQNGRVSLYGSYWNVAGSTSGLNNIANSSRHSPFGFSNSQQTYYESCPEFQQQQQQRYNYNGRY